MRKPEDKPGVNHALATQLEQLAEVANATALAIRQDKPAHEVRRAIDFVFSRTVRALVKHEMAREGDE